MFDPRSRQFALGRFKDAAELFEQGVREETGSGHALYNAAQAHRLAGDKKKALILYQNYLRALRPAGEQRRGRAAHRRAQLASAAIEAAHPAPPPVADGRSWPSKTDRMRRRAQPRRLHRRRRRRPTQRRPPSNGRGARSASAKRAGPGIWGVVVGGVVSSAAPSRSASCLAPRTRRRPSPSAP